MEGVHKLYFKDGGVYLDNFRLQAITGLKINSRMGKPTVLDLKILVDVNGLDSNNFEQYFKGEDKNG